jgi:hypothetical protein
MASFPDTQIELTAEAAFGADLTAAPSTWTWTDLSARLLNTPINIRRGVAVGASNQQTTSGTLQMLNNDGWLTPKLATSPYWPYVDSGTPFRLRVRTQTDVVDTFTRTAETNGWGTSTSGDVWAAVSTPSAFTTTGTQAQITHTAINTARQIRTPRVYRDVDFLFDVTANAVALGADHSVGPNLRVSAGALYRLWCTVELGLSGAVRLRVRQYVNSAGTSTTLTNTTVPALTYSAGTMIRCRIQVIGDTVKMRAWLAAGTEPSTWTVNITQTAVTGFNGAISPAVDQLGVQSTVFAGNTNTLPVVFTVDNVTVAQAHYDRLEGYIADVRPVFLPQSDGTTWSTVMIDVGGIGTRLEKNQSPGYSPMRRSVQLAPLPPIAYWPLEDDEGSLTAASAYPTGPSMSVTGPAVFSFDQGTPDVDYLSRYGTKPMVSVAAGARLTAVVPRSTVQTEWAISVVAEFYAPGVLPAVTEMRILQWDTPGGTFARWALVATPPGYTIRAYNDNTGTSTNVATYSLNFVGQVTYTIEAHQNGANIDVELFANDNSLAAGSVAGTLAALTGIAANPDRTNTTASVTVAGLKFIVGHLRVIDETSAFDTPRDTVPENGQLVTAIYAWYLEPAHRRLARICAEERVPFSLRGAPTVAGMTVLNSQQDGSFTELCTAAVEAESGGLLYEDGFGYTYLPRYARYNATVDLTVDMDVYKYSGGTDPGDVLVPQLDSRAANYWTISRTRGSSGSYAAPAAYRVRRGTIAEERTLDVLTDDVLVDHASWRTHLGVDGQGPRYPGTPVDLAANPELVDEYLRVTIGSRVQRLNQPTVAGVGVIDQVVEGIAETISPDSWTAELTGTPGDVWDVALYDNPARRKDSSSTVTNATYAAGVGTIVFKTTLVGDVWSTTTTPYDCEALGEKFTVTAMGAVTGSGPYLQTATVTRAVNGVPKALPAGTPIHIHPDQLARYAL